MNKVPDTVAQTVAHSDHNSAAAEGLLCLARALSEPAEMLAEVTTTTAVKPGHPKGTTVAEIQLQKKYWKTV